MLDLWRLCKFAKALQIYGSAYDSGRGSVETMCDEVFWESRINKVYLYPQELQLLLTPLHEVEETLGSEHLFHYYSGLVKLHR